MKLLIVFFLLITWCSEAGLLAAGGAVGAGCAGCAGGAGGAGEAGGAGGAGGNHCVRARWVLGLGEFDDNPGASNGFLLERRSKGAFIGGVKHYWELFASSDDCFFLGPGLYYDFPLAKGVRFTPSFGLGFYEEGDDKDLGSALQFRSGVAISFSLGGSRRSGGARRSGGSRRSGGARHSGGSRRSGGARRSGGSRRSRIGGLRLGFMYHHLSNMGLANPNPGAESFLVVLSFGL